MRSRSKGSAMQRRRWPVAAALSVVCPGLGHVYVGRALRGIGVSFGSAAVLVALGAADLLGEYEGWCAAMLVAVGSYLFLLADAVRVARGEDPVAKWYFRWYGYALALSLFVAQAAATSALRPWLGYLTNVVRGDSMAPTLMPNDSILVDTNEYEDTAPRVGDVVVVEVAEDSRLIRRVVASHGDTLTLGADSPSDTFGPFEVPTSSVRWRVKAILFSGTGVVRTGTRI